MKSKYFFFFIIPKHSDEYFIMNHCQELNILFNDRLNIKFNKKNLDNKYHKEQRLKTLNTNKIVMQVIKIVVQL